MDLDLARERGEHVATPFECPRTPSDACALRILIVEDDDDAGASLADLLSFLGHAVRLTASGEEGLAAVAREVPDVLICDVGLPDLSGIELIRRVRAAGQCGRMFAIALSGFAQRRDREEALEAGFDAHLAKPPDLHELQRTLLAAGARRGSGATAAGG